MSDRRTNIELLLKTLKEAYTDLALLKADLDDVEAKNRVKAERVRLDRKLNNETVKRRNRLDHNSQSTLPPKRDVPSSAPKRPVGRDASGAPNIGTGRAARQKIEADKQPTVVRGTGVADAKAKALGLKVVKGDVVDIKTKEVISTDHKPAPKKLVNNQHRPSYKDTLNHIKNSGSLEVKPALVKAKSKAKAKAKVAKADGPGFDASWNPFGQKPAPATPPPEKKPEPAPEKPKVDFFQHVVDVNTGKKR